MHIIFTYNFLKGSNGYKFAFQGQEAENELYGAGNASFFKYRISDNRLGRFFAIDPLAAKYPYNSPYAFSENRVIDGVELEGLEVEVINQTTYTDEITNMTYTFENFNVNYDLPQSNNIILNQIDYTIGISNTSVLEPAVITPKPSQIQQANSKTATNNAITLNKNKPITPTKSSNICYDCSRFEKSLEGHDYRSPGTITKKDVTVGLAVVGIITGTGALLEGGSLLYGGLSLLNSTDDILGVVNNGNGSFLQNNSTGTFNNVISYSKTIVSFGTGLQSGISMTTKGTYTGMSSMSAVNDYVGAVNNSVSQASEIVKKK
ncbi:MAG: hypothetical protein BWY22_01891 [Bacteroidetes bacterium ADurb.Bin217]|nr:MAG: hypothetical protein BWY22_01891 [Bacteroidetes bacterium ADurb.Bin217]